MFHLGNLSSTFHMYAWFQMTLINLVWIQLPSNFQVLPSYWMYNTFTCVPTFRDFQWFKINRNLPNITITLLSFKSINSSHSLNYIKQVYIYRLMQLLLKHWTAIISRRWDYRSLQWNYENCPQWPFIFGKCKHFKYFAQL